MSRVAVGEGHVFGVQGAKKQSHKGGKLDVVRKEVVDLAHDVDRRSLCGDQRSQECLYTGHVKAGRHAVPGHVRDGQSMGAVLIAKKVKVIAADYLGRSAEGRYLDIRDFRQLPKSLVQGSFLLPDR